MPVAGTKRPRPGRQKEILRVFTELVAERGYDLTSLAEVADQLGLSKGTIVYHFHSKDRMLQIMSHDYMTRRLAEVAEIFESFEAPEARLAGIIAALVTAHRDDRAATIAFSRELMRFADDPVMAEVRALRRDFASMLRALIEAGMEQGVFVRGDAGTVTLQIIGMCNWCWTWLRPDGRLTVEEVAATFVMTVLGGLANQTQLPAMNDVLEAVARIRVRLKAAA